MSISGIGSVGSDVYAALGKAGVTTKGQTVAQIRDQVDQMAMSGQLTTKQQMQLIVDGFQDMNAADKSYQPVGESGYSRSDTDTVDFVSTLQGYGDFAKSHGEADQAATYQSLIEMFK